MINFGRNYGVFGWRYCDTTFPLSLHLRVPRVDQEQLNLSLTKLEGRKSNYAGCYGGDGCFCLSRLAVIDKSETQSRPEVG